MFGTSLMNKLKRHAIVPFSTHQMFGLVDSIEDYPAFLPWCQSAVEEQRTEKEVVATLQIVWKGVHKSFTTRNLLDPHGRMEIQLLDGPLKHLNGIWQFTQLGDTASKVVLDLEFEFSGGWIDRLFQPVFQQIANTLVDAFCKRAVELYGNK